MEGIGTEIFQAFLISFEHFFGTHNFWNYHYTPMIEQCLYAHPAGTFLAVLNGKPFELLNFGCSCIHYVEEEQTFMGQMTAKV